MGKFYGTHRRSVKTLFRFADTRILDVLSGVEVHCEKLPDPPASL